MFGFDFQFWHFLYLLLLLPVIWIFGFRSLAGLGNVRRFLALALRSIVFVLLVFSIAAMQTKQETDRVAVMFLLDQSLSIPPAKRNFMKQYVKEAVESFRDDTRKDLAGVIVFAREAKIDTPAFDDDVFVIGESPPERLDATNLTAALKLAQASFPEDAAKRVVIVTDGNENPSQEASSVARLLAKQGIGIDVVPVTLESTTEVAIEKITLPSDVRMGQTVDAQVVIEALADPTEDNPNPTISGRVLLSRRLGQQEELLNPNEEDQRVVLRTDRKNVIPFRHKIEQSAAYTYTAEFIPDDAEADKISQNNQATAFMHVRGKGRILVIEDFQNRGDYDFLASRLRAQNMEVDVRGSDDLFENLGELQIYDCVILAGVPRSSGDDADALASFSDAQIEMLVQNTEQMGSGLIMLGGPNSFGAGGWTNTKIEEMMPVDFQIKNAKIDAVGALVLMMHASEMADGNYWQKVIGEEALKALGPMDYCGLIHWNDQRGTDDWLWGGNTGLIRVADKRKSMLARIAAMSPGDMPQFEPAMVKALTAFNGVNASVKHMIIISDGDPARPTNATIAGYVTAGIQITTVAVGTHGAPGSTPLEELATQTGGKYYVVRNAKALPKIYQREARRVARPLVFEPAGGVSTNMTYQHEMLIGIDPATLPPLKGYVMTSLKENPLVEQSLIADKPADALNSTILASWNYGVGRTVAFTSDAGKRWADEWTSWEDYDKFFGQMVRWASRPSGEEGGFTVATDVQDGKVRVVVTALDEENEFRNFLSMSGSAVDPELGSFPVEIKQVAPGRYVGEFDADKPGSYFVNVSPGVGEDGRRLAPIFAGVNMPYSAEYRDRSINMNLITDLVSREPVGGEPGILIGDGLQVGSMEELLKDEFNVYRRTLAKAESRQDYWPWLLVVAAVCFFADVLVRRLSIDLDWLQGQIGRVYRMVFRRHADAEPDERMDRLRSRKAAMEAELQKRRESQRYEPEPEVQSPPLAEADLDQALGTQQTSSSPRPASARPSSSPDGPEEESYTSRLLKAKKQAQKDQKRNDES